MERKEYVRKETMGVVRTTYLIDEEGVIEKCSVSKSGGKSTADAGRIVKHIRRIA